MSLRCAVRSTAVCAVRRCVREGSVQEGPNVVQFPDGGRVEFNMPFVRMGGFLWGDRVVEWLGDLLFTDAANGLQCGRPSSSSSSSCSSCYCYCYCHCHCCCHCYCYCHQYLVAVAVLHTVLCCLAVLLFAVVSAVLVAVASASASGRCELHLNPDGKTSLGSMFVAAKTGSDALKGS